AAAMITTSGFCAFIQSSTGCWRRRSTSARPAVSVAQPSPARRRTMALPTMPRWPATKTRRPASSKPLGLAALALMLLAHGLEVARDHFRNELAEAGLVGPAEFLAGLARIAQQEIDLRRAEIARVDRDQDLAGLAIHALLLGSGTTPGDLASDFREGEFDE